jgi:hypothetical protein
MKNTQEAHDTFRGSAEISKWIRAAAPLAELCAAALALHAIYLIDSTLAAWRPITAFLLLVTAASARAYGAKVERFAEECRRVSARAFAIGSDIPIGQCSAFRSDAPMFARYLAQRLPASTLESYYEPTCGVGPDRLREVYAHSAFFTWRLLRTSAIVHGIGSLLLVLSTVLLMYALVTSDLPRPVRLRALDALFSVALGVAALRLVGASIRCAFSARGTRLIADALIGHPLPGGQLLDHLTRCYDFERMGAPQAPTILYKTMRARLSNDWNHRRGALANRN